MIFDTALDIVGAFVEILRRQPRVRSWVLGISITFASIGIVLGILSNFVLPEISKTIEPVASILGGVCGFLLILTAASYTGVKIKGGGVITFELEKIHKERQKIQERLSEQPKPDVIDTIQLNLNQLSEYYTINKSQARTSFGFSVFAIVAGLVTIVGGIWLFYFQETKRIELTAISTIAGVLVEFIGAAYFYVYRKSLEQLNFFFTQLVRMQDTMLSVRLCEQIIPEERRVLMLEKIVLTLLQRSSQGLVIPALTEQKGPEKAKGSRKGQPVTRDNIETNNDKTNPNKA